MIVSTPAAAPRSDRAGLSEIVSPPIAADLPLPAPADIRAAAPPNDAKRHEEPARLLDSACAGCSPQRVEDARERAGGSPAQASPGGDHYLVIARHRAGNYAPEREETDLVSREQTVRDIYEGQIEEVARIVAFDPGRGTCRDATAEIARDVAGLHFTEASEPHWRRRDWLHKVLGVQQADLILGVRR